MGSCLHLNVGIPLLLERSLHRRCELTSQWFVRDAAETFCSAMLAVYKLGDDSKSSILGFHYSLGVC